MTPQTRLSLYAPCVRMPSTGPARAIVLSGRLSRKIALKLLEAVRRR